MNNNNVFYQLREQDDNNLIKPDRVNGNFNVNLKKPLILNEGDELIINKAVIDTRTLESDKIILQNDINIQINFAYYLLNDNISHKINVNGNTAWTTADLDYELYVLSIPTGPANPTEVFELKQVQYLNPNLFAGPGPSNPDWEATFLYIDVNNVPRNVKVNMTLILDPNDDKKLIWIGKEYVIATALPNPIGDVPFADITDPKVLRGNGIYGSYGTLKLTIEEDPEGLNTYSPFINKTQITLKAGDYNYSDFADRINQEITFINSNDILTNLTPAGSNTLLLNTGHPIYDTPATGLYEKGAIWIRSTDGGKGFKLEAKSVLASSPEDQVYFGTNQFVLLFDDITNRFYFKY